METPAPINARLAYFRSQIDQPAPDYPSPFGRWLGGIFRVADPERMVADYLIREDMTNPMGMLHGGVASAILDEIVGMMVFTMGRENAYISVNLNTDFLHSARVGEVLTATAEVIRAGKNIVHAEGHLTAADGKIVAKCTTNMIQTSAKLPF